MCPYEYFFMKFDHKTKLTFADTQWNQFSNLKELGEIRVQGLN